MSTDEVIVPSWPAPKGYANGRTGRGQVVHVAGQIGWDEHGTFAAASEDELVRQLAKALDNVIAVVAAAGGRPEDLATMTIYVTGPGMEAYRTSQRAIGEVWRARMGRHYPAIALVGIQELVERQALVEIQATAYVGEAP